MVCLCFTPAQTNAKDINIAVVTDHHSDWSNKVIEALNNELSAFSDSELTFILRSEDILASEWNRTKAKQHLESALKNNSVDIVVALGLLSSDAAAFSHYSKPLIAANVLDATKQAFPFSDNGTSGKHNLHYLITNADIATELTRFQETIGGKKIGVMVDPIVFNTLGFLKEELKRIQSMTNFDVQPLPLTNLNVKQTVDNINIPNDIDGLFVIPQFQLGETKNKQLIDGLNARQMPTYSMLGLPDVELGYLMGTALIPSSQQLARRLAIDIRDIGLGRDASDLSIAFDVKDRISVNMQTARDIKFSPPFTVLSESNIINELENAGRTLSLYTAVDEALKRNFDLALSDESYKLARLNTKISRSALLPQLSANTSWNRQDRDLAFTRQTETTSVGLGVTQSLYSESNWSNYTSSKFLEEAQRATFESTRLDIIESTAQAYLNVLIAKTQLSIQRDNLKLTLANLDRARFRYRVGSTSRAEVLRFETQLANDKQSIANAQNSYQQSLHQLNRILNQPIAGHFQVSEPNLSDPKIFSDPRLGTFIQNPKQLGVFSNFLVEQTNDNAPELVSLQKEIKAQERELLATKRKRYVPDVNLNANVDRVVDDNADPFESNYDNDWSVGVELTWTLYQGNRISAERSQAQITLQRLKYSFYQLQNSLETNTRNAISQATTSKININFANASAKAAEQTLELVTDSYVRGTSNYIDLIDAQSSYITAKLSSANATYEHLSDLIALQRAIGFFDFYVSPEQEEQWFDALNQYAKHNEASK